jgi:hypothetical protein
MELSQMVAIFYDFPEPADKTLDERLGAYRETFLKVVSKAPYKDIEKRVLIEEVVYIFQDEDSASGHCAKKGIKFTFMPGSRVKNCEKWKIDIDNLIWALMPELRCYSVLVTKTKATIYRL